MAKQTFTTGQVLTAAQMTSLQQTAMGGGSTTAKTASYVLVAADAGTVVQMNAAGATTITVNTALFAAGDTIQIQNVGAGVCTVTAGTATVSTSSSLALKQYDAGSLYFNTTSAAIFFATDAADSTSPLTTKGDLYTFSTLDARLPVGSNGQTLVADSTASTGLKWETPFSGGTWTTFTPTFTNLTLGNGGLTARYLKVGGLVNFRVQISFGSTTSITGRVSMTWPVAPLSLTAAQSALVNVQYEDQGVGPTLGSFYTATATTSLFAIFVMSTSGTYGGVADLSATVPFTWASTDQINLAGTYEVTP